ncbi:MAG: hypothetical protein WCK31_04455 [bacterium]
MKIKKETINIILYLSILFTTIFLVLAITTGLWVNEFSYLTNPNQIAKVTTTNYIQNIDGTSSFKLTLNKENDVSNIDHLFNPNNKGISTTNEYLLNGDRYTVEIIKIEWSDLFKSLGLNRSYKITGIKSGYVDSSKQKANQTDTFTIDGGLDEFINTVIDNPDLSSFFAKSIIKDTKTYSYLESPLVTIIK